MYFISLTPKNLPKTLYSPGFLSSHSPFFLSTSLTISLFPHELYFLHLTLLTRVLSSAHYSSHSAHWGDLIHFPALATTYTLRLLKAISRLRDFPHTQSPAGPSCSTAIINPTHPKANAPSVKPSPDMHFLLQLLPQLTAPKSTQSPRSETWQLNQLFPLPTPSSFTQTVQSISPYLNVCYCFCGRGDGLFLFD